MVKNTGVKVGDFLDEAYVSYYKDRIKQLKHKLEITDNETERKKLKSELTKLKKEYRKSWLKVNLKKKLPTLVLAIVLFLLFNAIDSLVVAGLVWFVSSKVWGIQEVSFVKLWITVYIFFLIGKLMFAGVKKV